jgi:hypothetical protein
MATMKFLFKGSRDSKGIIDSEGIRDENTLTDAASATWSLVSASNRPGHGDLWRLGSVSNRPGARLPMASGLSE